MRALAISLGLVLIYLIWTFNRMVGLRKRADGAWSDVDVQLKRRWDLVPALVETVKGYARHETKTLEQVTSARTGAQQAQSITTRGARESALSGAVRGIFEVSIAGSRSTTSSARTNTRCASSCSP